jgi:DNA-binding NarL/FixJ family response regulator
MSKIEPAAQSTVWLIEDNAAFRRSVARTIDHDPAFRCTGEFSRCEDAFVALARGEVPRVILLDVGLPGISGLDAIPRLRELVPAAAIIVITVFEDDAKIFHAICAGASGYLLKTAPPAEIAQAIHEVLAGGAPMNGRIARRVLKMFSQLAPPQRDYGLTERERGVLQLMSEGLIKKEIADRLSLSVHTVDTHLRNIYAKLEVGTRTGAVAKALKENLL